MGDSALCLCTRLTRNAKVTPLIAARAYTRTLSRACAHSQARSRAPSHHCDIRTHTSAIFVVNCHIRGHNCDIRSHLPHSWSCTCDIHCNITAPFVIFVVIQLWHWYSYSYDIRSQITANVHNSCKKSNSQSADCTPPPHGISSFSSGPPFGKPLIGLYTLFHRIYMVLIWFYLIFKWLYVVFRWFDMVFMWLNNMVSIWFSIVFVWFWMWLFIWLQVSQLYDYECRS